MKTVALFAVLVGCAAEADEVPATGEWTVRIRAADLSCDDAIRDRALPFTVLQDEGGMYSAQTRPNTIASPDSVPVPATAVEILGDETVIHFKFETERWVIHLWPAVPGAMVTWASDECKAIDVEAIVERSPGPQA